MLLSPRNLSKTICRFSLSCCKASSAPATPLLDLYVSLLCRRRYSPNSSSVIHCGFGEEEEARGADLAFAFAFGSDFGAPRLPIADKKSQWMRCMHKYLVLKCLDPRTTCIAWRFDATSQKQKHFFDSSNDSMNAPAIVCNYNHMNHLMANGSYITYYRL